ncbi:MAG: hypothetical protein ABIU63_04870 [Chitinophagaceae bacterium]
MKKALLCLLLIPFAGISRLNNILPPAGSIVDIRTGEWPIALQRTVARSDTSYSLQFRDMQVMSGVVMDTLSFNDVVQLKYFEKALTVLKTGHTGDIARFSDYSIKRADKKYQGTWYILKLKYGLTDFKQSEADILIKTIKGLKFE